MEAAHSLSFPPACTLRCIVGLSLDSSIATGV